MRRLAGLVAAAAVAATAGCDILMPRNGTGTNRETSAPQLEALSGQDTVAESLLDKAIDKAAESNRLVAEIEAGAAAAGGFGGPEPVVPEGVILPPELLQPITVEWTGPITPLLTALAEHIGYEFSVAGQPPAQPVVVTIHRRHEPVWRVFRDAGAVITTRGLVVVAPADRRIEMRWPSAS